MSTRPSTRPLTAALGTIPDNAWTPPSNYADNRVHHLYQRCDLVKAGQWSPEAEPFRDMLERAGFVDRGRPMNLDARYPYRGPVHDAWLSRIQPGGYIVPHTDRSRWRERWQIPIQPAGLTVIDGLAIDTEAGVPFRFEHWLPHSVVNTSDRDRIHLVIDLDRYVGPDETRPFVIL